MCYLPVPRHQRKSALQPLGIHSQDMNLGGRDPKLPLLTFPETAHAGSGGGHAGPQRVHRECDSPNSRTVRPFAGHRRVRAPRLRRLGDTQRTRHPANPRGHIQGYKRGSRGLSLTPLSLAAPHISRGWGPQQHMASPHQDKGPGSTTLTLDPPHTQPQTHQDVVIATREHGQRHTEQHTRQKQTRTITLGCGTMKQPRARPTSEEARQLKQSKHWAARGASAGSTKSVGPCTRTRRKSKLQMPEEREGKLDRRWGGALT